MNNLKKVLRYIQIYGFGKTFFKVAGRNRGNLRWTRRRKASVVEGKGVAVLGCGQFAFSTVGYTLSRHYGNLFVDCFDVDPAAQSSFADFYQIESPASTVDELIGGARVGYVYVTSNHATHADYAIEAIEKGKTVYIEKPIAVTAEQLARLVDCVERANCTVFAGYNRPFSKAIRDLKQFVSENNQPLTFNCFVSGHLLSSDHWYRDPSEGTRICGNVGHWLDLAVHVLCWGTLPDQWEITIAYSSPKVKDDDISVSMTSSRGDLLVFVLTSRCEPFEGINETINLQQGATICKIDDFRTMSIWREDKMVKRRYWPKNVGHDAALRQPFEQEPSRNWAEVVSSALLMLHIADMVKTGQTCSSFSFAQGKSELQVKLNA